MLILYEPHDPTGRRNILVANPWMTWTRDDMEEVLFGMYLDPDLFGCSDSLFIVPGTYPED